MNDKAAIHKALQLAKLLRARFILNKVIEMHTLGYLNSTQIQMVFAGVCEPVWAMSIALDIQIHDLFEESEHEAVRMLGLGEKPDNQEDGS